MESASWGTRRPLRPHDTVRQNVSLWPRRALARVTTDHAERGRPDTACRRNGWPCKGTRRDSRPGKRGRDRAGGTSQTSPGADGGGNRDLVGLRSVAEPGRICRPPPRGCAGTRRRAHSRVEGETAPDSFTRVQHPRRASPGQARIIGVGVTWLLIGLLRVPVLEGQADRTSGARPAQRSPALTATKYTGPSQWRPRRGPTQYASGPTAGGPHDSVVWDRWRGVRRAQRATRTTSTTSSFRHGRDHLPARLRRGGVCRAQAEPSSRRERQEVDVLSHVPVASGPQWCPVLERPARPDGADDSTTPGRN